MRRGNFQVVNTFGDRAQDEEIQRLIGRLEALEQAATATQSTPAPVVSGTPLVPAAIEVKEIDGDPDLFVFGLEFDSLDGFSVTADADIARLDLVANATPADIAAAASQGSAGFVYGDHTHKGVHSVSVNGATPQFGDVTVTIPAPGGGSLANFSAMRWRAYQSGIGSNITGLDSSYYQIAATDGANFPGGATKQANFRHDSAILRGVEGNQWVMWGRLKVTVANQPKTVNWFVPNVDDNFYAVIEKPADLAGTITITTGTSAVVGTGTAFLTDFAVGDAIRFGGGISGASGNEIMYVSAIADNAHMTLAHVYNRGGLSLAASTYTVCKKIYEAHNQVAQTPVNQKSSISLTANGDWFLHIFGNNDGNTQGAFNFATDLVDSASITLGDVGSETF